MTTQSPADGIVVFVTAPGQDAALSIARAVVEARLAACVNMIPAIRSIYRWKGEVCDEAETLLVMKTVRERFEALSQKIREIHSYEVPEIIALPIVGGWGPYLDWVRTETTPGF